MFNCKCGRKAAPGHHLCYDCDPQLVETIHNNPVCQCGKPKPIGEFYCGDCYTALLVAGERQADRSDRHYEE